MDDILELTDGSLFKRTRLSDYLIDESGKHKADICTEARNIGLRISHFTWYKKSKFSEGTSLLKNSMSGENYTICEMNYYDNSFRSFHWLANDYNFNDAAYLDKEKREL